MAFLLRLDDKGTDKNFGPRLNTSRFFIGPKVAPGESPALFFGCARHGANLAVKIFAGLDHGDGGPDGKGVDRESRQTPIAARESIR